MRAFTTLSLLLLSALLAAPLPGGAQGFPMRPDAPAQAGEDKPLRPDPGRFEPFQLPPMGPKEDKKSSNGRIRGIADELNRRLGSAYEESAKTGDAKAPVEVIEAYLPELNAVGQQADLDAGSREQIAKYNLQTRRYEVAQELSNRTLEADPEHRDALTNRAGARYGLGNIPGAIADATRAVKADPKHQAAYAVRALAHYANRDYLQAAEDAKRALSIDRNNKTAFSILKLSESRIRPVVKLPEDKLGENLEVQREYQGMIHQLNQVEEKTRLLIEEGFPRPVDKLLKSASNKISLKDYWAAIEDADKAVAKAPDCAEAYYLRAAAHNLVGEYGKAAQDATQSLAIDPNDAAARDARSWAFYRMGRLNDAIADANHSLELNPKNPYAYANRGFINEKRGDFRSMIADLKSAAALNPQFEPVFRDAIARSNLERAPLLSAPPRPDDLTPEARSAEKGRRSSFITIITSSLIGGFLIALGLLHIMSNQWQKKLTTEIRKGHSRSATLRPSPALDSTYEIGRVLGQGGMGVVYEGVDRALKRKVAIKMLRPELKADPRDRDRFLEEARTVAALHHPAIVEIFSILEDKAGLYLVFEFMEGKSVEELLAKKKRLSLAETKAILRKVCQALHYAHDHGVVHRDLKPSNIMITVEGSVKVMDFGIAKAAQESTGALNMTNTILGTPFYMAPEQSAGIVRKESDIFSLGACLYEMVTGERPYPSPASTPMKIAAEYVKPSRLATLPEGLDALVDAALHPDPDKRIRSARDFWGWLDKIKDPSGAKTPRLPEA